MDYKGKPHLLSVYKKLIICHNVRDKENSVKVSFSDLFRDGMNKKLVEVFPIFLCVLRSFFKEISCHSFYNFWRFIMFPMKFHFLSF